MIQRLPSEEVIRNIGKLPKILLHTHLEGSVPITTLDKLSKRNGIIPPFQVKSDVISEMCLYKGWNGFLSLFYAISSCFKTRQDFHDSIVEYGESLVEENILYAEIHLTPWNHISQGVSLNEIGEGLFSGMEMAKKRLGIRLKIIVDLVRSPSENVEGIMSWLRDLPRSHFAALGLSGGPNSVPLERFQTVCERASDMGLGLVAHAGELEGPMSIRIALRDLKVDRICHGVRVVEDNIILNQAKLAGMHFELCPSSNRILGIGQPAYGSIKDMLNSLVSCSINTDDELLFDTTLTKELGILLKNRIVTYGDIYMLQENAARAAFMQSSERQSFLSYITSFHDEYIDSMKAVE